jgi:hypothetical protein
MDSSARNAGHLLKGGQFLIGQVASLREIAAIGLNGTSIRGSCEFRENRQKAPIIIGQN